MSMPSERAEPPRPHEGPGHDSISLPQPTASPPGAASTDEQLMRNGSLGDVPPKEQDPLEGPSPEALVPTMGKGSQPRSPPELASARQASDSSSAPPAFSSTTTDTTRPNQSDGNTETKGTYAYNPGERTFTLRPLRQQWWQLWRWRSPPPPPPLRMEDAAELPIPHANWYSYISFGWMTPLMLLGYRRPLEATDFWAMDKSRSAEFLSQRLLDHWEKRVSAAESYNQSIADGSRRPGLLLKTRWATNYAIMGLVFRRPKALELPPSVRAKLWVQPPPPGAYTPKPPKGAPVNPSAPPIPDNYSGFQRPSLILSVHDGFKREIWLAALFRLLADMSQLLSTLVLRQIITFGQDVYAGHRYPELGLHTPPVGKGVAMAFGLFLMTWFSSICQHHFFFRGQSNGIFIRASLISAIFQRGLHMNGQDRAPGKLTNHISTDVSRIDFAANWCVICLTAPIQLIVGLIILLCEIGVSALAGYAVLVAAVMILLYCMVLMFGARKQSMVWTDKRAKAIAEILSSMRIVKSFGFEPDFLDRLHKIRKNELHGIRSLLLLRSGASAVAFSSTVLGSVVAFVVYSLTGHNLDAAKIFSSLTLFNLTRMPLMILPLALSSSTDAINAFLRLQGVFEAPIVKDANVYDDNSPDGIRLENASFQWLTVKVEDHVGIDGPKVGDQPKGRKAQRTASSKLPDQEIKEPKRRTKITSFLKRKSSDPSKDPALALQLQTENAANAAEQGITQDRLRAGKDDPAEPGALDALGPQPAGMETEADDASSPTAGSTLADIEPRKAEPFSMRNVSLHIKRGQLCAIVGPVGSGKSSLLEGCIGEMQRLGGNVVWSSRRVGYCPQTAWIRSATLRDNILFGQPFDPKRYWNVVKISELTNDLKMLQAGDLSEIGEKGVTLSGGQKQRVNIARALYSNPDIYLFDDPLSALDAHVGKAVFLNAILPLRTMGKTVILITHALQYLPQCDQVMVMERGEVIQNGTYAQLLQDRHGAFARLIEEFGSSGSGEEEEEGEKALALDKGDGQRLLDQAEVEHDRVHSEQRAPTQDREAHPSSVAVTSSSTPGTTEPEPHISVSKLTETDVEKLGTEEADENDLNGKEKGNIITAEERNTGAVGWAVYSAYFKAGHGYILVPLSLASIALMQAMQVLNSYWLVWWEENTFPLSRGAYMGIYAALGVGQAIFTFLMGASMGYLSFYACKTLHQRAMFRTMYAPMSFMDVTPQGRIMSRFAKDIDVLDNQLQDAVRMLINTLASVLGAVILITVLTHYFIAIVAGILIIYVFGAAFYRSSAREIKRLDSLLRSALYSHFAECLAGIGTLRAYGVTKNIQEENYRKVDEENRAYLLTITSPRWLGIRLDVLGSLLILIVALILVCTAKTISPGQVGVALSYILSTAQLLTLATRQVAEVENDMNAVERILYYADALPQEAEQVTTSDKPLRWNHFGNDGLPVGRTQTGAEKGANATTQVGLPAAWPERGEIELRNIKLRYRPELPLVLKGISMHVPGGTKVGIVGRTGAGKSSLLGGLLRLTELAEGQILIDGIDVSRIGLRDLRRRLAILPQDPLLFSGTLRSNLDPFGQWDDARLWDSLRRSSLVGDAGTPTGPGGAEALTLDMPIEEGGLNLSLGQRSLVSLARALCKSSRIILLDEATASADSATDAKVQATIREQFADRTLLCIAHRLITILSYDRIAVFSQGYLVEYNSPLKLFDDAASHFHDMCTKAGVGRADILAANGLGEQHINSETGVNEHNSGDDAKGYQL